MPGLVGIFDPRYSSDRPGVHELDALLDRMCAAIARKPWYQTYTYVRPPFAAGRVGLGMINPQPQPAMNEEGTVWVWMDGEIYDFQRKQLVRQLKESGHQIEGNGDAELIAHLYEDMGEDCVRDLDGTFAIAIYDMRPEDGNARRSKLMLAVDREASRPLYYFSGDGNGGRRFLFASEVKAILEDERVPRTVDEHGAIELFTLRHVSGDRTLVKDVHFLVAGHLLTFEDGQVHVRPYWMPKIAADQRLLPYDTYVQEIAEAVRRAMQRQMYDERPIGEYLSGGLDSRLLAGLVPAHTGSFHTFSRGPQDCWDVRFGAQVAQRVGSRHHYLALEPDYLQNAGMRGMWISDGLMTVNDIYMLSTIDQVKSYVDVVFLGNGHMDGILGGIELDGRLLRAASLDEAARIFYDHNSSYVPEKLQACVFDGAFYRRTRGLAYDAVRQTMGQFESDTFHGQVEAFCAQCRWPRSASWGAILSRTQVETRSPYSDHDFCDLVCRVPAQWRADRQMQLAVLKYVRPDLARVPWANTGLPASLSTPKTVLMMRAYFRVRREIANLTGGWIPPVLPRDRAYHAQWYRTVLRPWLEGILLDERTLDRGYYAREGIRTLIDDHMSGRRDRFLQFGLLLAFELWNRLFIDRVGLDGDGEVKRSGTQAASRSLWPADTGT